MKKLLLGLVVALALLLFVQSKLFHKRGLDLATASFEAGCITEGRDMCLSQYSKEDDYSVNMRGLCFELILTDCQNKSLEFFNWMAGKK